MNTEIRELTDADIDIVSGGSDPNYKFCWDGPAGTGTYPISVDCDPPTVKDLIGAFLQGVEQGRGKGGKPA
jgi:hypothetical protein